MFAFQLLDYKVKLGNLIKHNITHYLCYCPGLCLWFYILSKPPMNSNK